MELPATSASQVSQAVSGLLEMKAVYSAKATRDMRYRETEIERAIATWGKIEPKVLGRADFDSFREVLFPNDMPWDNTYSWVGAITFDTASGRKSVVIQTFYRDPIAVRTAFLHLGEQISPGNEKLLTRDEIVQLFSGLRPGGPDERALDLLKGTTRSNVIEETRDLRSEDIPDTGPADIPEPVRRDLDEIIDALIHADSQRIEEYRQKDDDEVYRAQGYSIDVGYRDLLKRLDVQFVPLPLNSVSNDYVGEDLNQLNPGESTWMGVYLYTATAKPSQYIMRLNVARIDNGDYRVQIENIGV